MASIIETVATQIATAIGAQIDYVPQFELKDFRKEKLLVLPIGSKYEQISRGSKEIRITLEIAYVKRVDEKEISTLLEKVQDLVQTVQNTKVYNGRGYVAEVLNTPTYDVDAMITEKKFLSVMSVEIRII